MRVCVFEDAACENLYPLTYTRAAFELRCGFDSLLDKIERAYPEAEIALWTREAYADLARERFAGVPVNDAGAVKGDCLWVNGRALVTDPAKMPDAKGPAVAFMKGETLLALRASDVAPPAPGSAPEAPSGTAAEEADVDLIDWPWDLVAKNPSVLASDFAAYGKSGVHGETHKLTAVLGDKSNVYVAPSAELHPFVEIDARHGPVYIDEEVEVAPQSRIEGPAYIGRKTMIVGGKIREGCSFGPVCRMGGEVEEAIVHGYSNKYHDGFLGHAYVGEWVNLGAMTTNSDLKNDYTTVEVYAGGKSRDTGDTKVGSFIGDHTKTGIGTLLNTGTVIGVMCNVLSTGDLPPKFLPSFTWFFRERFSKGKGFRRMVETAKTAMSRRGRELTDAEYAVLKHVYDLTGEVRTEEIKRTRAMRSKG